MTGPKPVSTDWQILELLAATPVSRTWRVAIGDQLAVLRQDEPGAGRLGLDRVAEPGVLRAAAAAGLGPRCLLADPARGELLTQWLPGRAWSAAELREPGNLVRAAALLRRLHATPLTGPLVDLGAGIDRYAAAAGGEWADLAAAAREQLARALGVGAPLGATVVPEGAPMTGGAAEPLCFCHNDPTPGNFIAAPDGGLHLIDWEYAGRCHPGFDLGGLAAGADLTEELVVVLLTAYRGRPPSRAETDRHRSWQAFCRTLGALWARVLEVPLGEADPGLRADS